MSHAPPDSSVDAESRQDLRLGLRVNIAQFSLLVGINALVGGMVGQERTILPLIAKRIFHLGSFTPALTFIVAFGAVKAVTNLVAGTLADRIGRKPMLVAGWIVGIPVPLLLMWAPTWGWVIFANVLLGVNQGLTWSTTVIMKIDIAGPNRRGLAMALNETAGYGAVAITAAATGFIAERAGLRPEPFFLGLAFAALGLGASVLFVRETKAHARFEGSQSTWTPLGARKVFALTSFRDRALSACSQAGFVNNLNDGMAWGLLPIYFAAGGLSIGAIGALAALYPAVWSVGQLAAGPLSDRLGRKWMISAGMGVQAAAIALLAATSTFAAWAVAAIVLGIGTAMVYPVLLAAIGDVSNPAWRASAVGVYRLWRDAGFVAGALLTGIIADAAGMRAAIYTVAVLTALSGLIVAGRMYETHPIAWPRRPAGREQT